LLILDIHKLQHANWYKHWPVYKLSIPTDNLLDVGPANRRGGQRTSFVEYVSEVYSRYCRSLEHVSKVHRREYRSLGYVSEVYIRYFR
jgi:hypothetical protein